MGTPESGHGVLDVALRWEEGNNHVVSLYHCRGTLVCVQIVLCHEAMKLLSVQALPNLKRLQGVWLSAYL